MRSRAFCFTFNNYTDADIERIEQIDYKYLCYGKEIAPTTGTPHLQGYIYFKSQRSKVAVCKMGLGNIAVAKGTALQNKDYCSKEGTFKELGQIPLSGKRTDLTNLRDAIKDKRLTFDDIVEDHLPILARYPNFIEKLQDHYHPPKDLDVLDNLWIYGPPGTGKTSHAKTLGSYYIKMPNKWFCGYNGQDNVIVEDIGPDQGKFLQHFLKIWADHSPFTAQTKGSSKVIRPARILVTSNYSIDEIGFDEVTTQAIKRRFKGYHMGKKM